MIKPFSQDLGQELSQILAEEFSRAIDANILKQLGIDAEMASIDGIQTVIEKNHKHLKIKKNIETWKKI